MVWADCHCHLSVDATEQSVVALKKKLHHYQAHDFYLMCTYWGDFELIRDHLLLEVVPFYGIHPWYSHLYTTVENVSKLDHYNSVLVPKPPPELVEALPQPKLLREQIEEYEAVINTLPPEKKFGIGEIGLDKVFRVPVGLLGYTDDISKCHVDMHHQVMVYQTMLEFAQKYNAPVLIHCVKAHGKLFDVTTKTTRAVVKSRRQQERDKQAGIEDEAVVEIPLILHSWSGLVDQVQLWNKYPKVFFSLSDWINGQKLIEWVKGCAAVTELDYGLDNWLVNKEAEYLESIRGIGEKLDGIGIGEGVVEENIGGIWR